MKRSTLLVSLITMSSIATAATRASIVPVSRQSEVAVQGAVGDKTFNHSNSTQGVTGWSGDAVGYVDDTQKDYSTASAGQGSAFEFDHGNLSKIALEMTSDAAQRGGSVTGTSRFDLKFAVTNSAVQFHLRGLMDSLPENRLDFGLRNLEDSTAVFARGESMRLAPTGQFEKSGVLEPGQYELTALSVVRGISQQDSNTGLEATIEFATPTATAVPLPSVMSSAGLLSIAITLLCFGLRRYAPGFSRLSA